MSLLFSYRDADMYERDAKLFIDGNWLNDSCINFCFKAIEDKYPMHDSSVCLVDPAVVSFMRIQATDDEDFEEISGSLRIKARAWLLVPTNNCESFQSSSTHWSLVVYHVATGACFHLDSSNGFNGSAATSTCRTLNRLCARVSETNPMVVTLDCPQQSNGYDCGMFAVLFAEKTMQYLIENDLQLANDEPLPSDFTENFTDWIKGAVNQGLIPSLRTSYTQYVSDIVNRKAQGKL